MFQRRTKSALFIDYENVSHQSLPGTIANWLAWLEDGEFDEAGRGRHIIEKRIYWNTMAEQHREKFEAAGFTAVLCEKFSGLKNGADIRMALDVQELMLANRRIAEFILVTRDADFVPVLQRLAQHDRETAILVSEQHPQVHATFSHYADIVIPVRKFMAATTYKRPTRTIYSWLRTVAATRQKPKVLQTRDSMELATDHVIRVTSRKPNRHTAKEDIERELSKISGFSRRGLKSYLGTGSYAALMKGIAKRTNRIKVDPSGYGIAVRYVPEED